VEPAVRLLGNPGPARGNPLERHFRDIQCAAVHAPQEDLSLPAIGTKAPHLMPAAPETTASTQFLSLLPAIRRPSG
jgi:hypothetical protein